MERFLSEVVASQEQTTRGAIEHGEREHALESRGASTAPLAIRGENHFGIGVRSERVPACAEIAPEGAVVVDFAIERHPK